LKRFIDEPIQVSFQGEILLEKTPKVPQAIEWRGNSYPVVEVLNEWREFGRRGRMAKNMQPQHAARASKVGSWGVGRFFFTVRVQSGDIFEIYYDRAPKDIDNRKGEWVLVSVEDNQSTNLNP
jgi:hypothetical protein